MRIEYSIGGGIMLQWTPASGWQGSEPLARLALLYVLSRYDSPSFPWPEKMAAEDLAKELGGTVTTEGAPEFDPDVVY